LDRRERHGPLAFGALKEFHELLGQRGLIALLEPAFMQQARTCGWKCSTVSCSCSWLCTSLITRTAFHTKEDPVAEPQTHRHRWRSSK